MDVQLSARGNVAGFANFPVTSTNKSVPINCYVWRPSDGTKVGTILDGNTAATVDEVASSSMLVQQATFSGSAVNSAQAGDVIVCEIWFTTTQQFASSNTDEFAYDGTTANTTKNATVTNHASFLETPETISFAGGTTSVSQTSIHKYNLKQYIAQTNIQKYNLRVFVAATTSIHKYRIMLSVLQTSIHKYRLLQNIVQTSIHKYNMRKYIVQASIHKYTLRSFVAATASIHKYNLRKSIAQTSIHKYNILFSGTVIANSIHKYNIKRFILQTSIHKYNFRNFVAITTSIQKYNLRKFLAQTSIHKYRLKQLIAQTSIHKYNLAGSITSIDMTQTAAKSYANKFITKT